jgi:hypothetical protein
MGYSHGRYLGDMPHTHQKELFGRHEWARDLLVEKFRSNIKEYFNKELVNDRVRKKARFGDSIYEAMLSSVNRNQYLSMMTLWSVGQGIGVRVRSWVEEAIKDLILYQQEHFGREIEKVYTFNNLRRGGLLAENDAVAIAGEEVTEHSHRRQWLIPVRESIVRIAERLPQEIGSLDELRNWEYDRGELRPKLNVALPESAFVSLEGFPVERLEFQLAWLKHAALSSAAEAASWQGIICNLLVLEKPPGKVRAFRFASPSVSSRRALRDEKRNLLLLYGWLRQEKPFRVYEDSVEVFWTHLMDRPASRGQELFFRDQTLSYDQFWKFLNVPYGVLLESLAIAGQSLKRHLAAAVREATPRSIRKLEPDINALN